MTCTPASAIHKRAPFRISTPPTVPAGKMSSAPFRCPFRRPARRNHHRHGIRAARSSSTARLRPAPRRQDKLCVHIVYDDVPDGALRSWKRQRILRRSIRAGGRAPLRGSSPGPVWTHARAVQRFGRVANSKQRTSRGGLRDLVRATRRANASFQAAGHSRPAPVSYIPRGLRAASFSRPSSVRLREAGTRTNGSSRSGLLQLAAIGAGAAFRNRST